MTAQMTAHRVLTWAIDSAGASLAGGAAPLPSGPLRAARALAHPPEATLHALRELARRTAARIGAGAPPFGDPSGIGLGGLLLAAAIGGRAQRGQARLLAEALPPPRLEGPTRRAAGWSDALARHAVIAPALSALAAEPGRTDEGGEAGEAGADAEPLAELLLRCSPLTAILHRPAAERLAADTTTTEVSAAVDLLRRPGGTEVLLSALSQWSPDPAVLRWRTELLTRIAPARPDVVLDTYLTARVRHGQEWDLRVREAARRLNREPDDQAIATIRYWLPLSALRQRDRDLVRARPLLTGYQQALSLVEGRHRRSIAGAA